MERLESAVEVAVRVRPLIDSELARGCREVLEVIENVQQVRIKDTDKAFTYNYVFGPGVLQETVYSQAVEKKVRELFGGYNVTILAYGQTGSGKTHSMGKICLFEVFLIVLSKQIFLKVQSFYDMLIKP